MKKDEKKNHFLEHKTNKFIVSQLSSTNNNFDKKFFVKDNFWTQNLQTTSCSDFLDNFQTGIDATVIELLTQKGYHLIGKTVMDEFACGGTGLNANSGPIYNPFNPNYIIGGSSSGSALALVKNLASFSLVSDTGGSARQPAAYCGLFGFKPSYGAISRFGLIPAASSLDTVGIMSRSIEVIETIYQIIAKPDFKDLQTILYSKKKLKKKNENLFFDKKKKIAIIKNIEKYLKRDYAKAYCSFLDFLSKKEYQLEEIEIPKVIKENLLFGWISICFTELFSHLSALKGITFGNKESIDITDKRNKKLGLIVKERLLIGAYLLQKGIMERIYLWRKHVNNWIDKVFRKYYFIVFPTTKKEAVPIYQTDFAALGSTEHWSDNLLLIANLANFPSLNIPIGKVNELPIGITLNSKEGNDEQLLKFAREICK